MVYPLPSFADLKRRYHSDTTIDPDSYELVRLIAYLSLDGAPVATAEQIFQAIGALDGEEELAAFRCSEGVAVSHASDGWWLLVRYEPVVDTDKRVAGAGGC